MDEEAIVNYYGPSTNPSGVLQTSAAFTPYPAMKKTEKVIYF